MNEKDLMYFCAVYEERNISRAAEKIYITPQGLSKAIHRLESELNVVLFDRKKNGIVPTKYADRLYRSSKSIIYSLEQIKGIKSYENEKKELKLAFTLGVLDYLGMSFIYDFNEKYPDIELNIVQNTDTRVSSLILGDEAEGGFLAGPIDTTKFEGKLFTSHKHCAVINDSNPLSKKPFISYNDLNGVPIALEGREFQPFHNNMNRFLKNKVAPKIALETTEIESTHRFAANNDGIGLSVDFCAFAHPYDNTVIRPLEDEDCVWETYFVMPTGRKSSEELELFKKYAFDWLTDNNDKLFHWNYNKR